MSKQNQGNPNPNVDNQNGEADIQPTPDKGTEKKTLVSRIKHRYDQFRAKPAGKWIVRAGKLLGGGAVLFGTYEAGKHSAKPVTVYVEKIPEETESTVETEPAEAPVEETKE